MSFNLGILSGIGERSREVREESRKKNENILSSAANLWTHIAQAPDISDEGRKHAIGMALLAGTSDPSGKLPKEISDLTPIHEGVQPQMGGSWLGGETTNRVSTSNMPIQSTLDQGAAEVRIPPSSPFEVPMPQPPTQARTPYFKTSTQRSNEAARALQTKEDIEANAAIRRERAKQEAEKEFAIPPVRNIDPNSPAGIAADIAKEQELKRQGLGRYQTPTSSLLPKVNYNNGIPVTITKGADEYVIGDPNMPPDLKPIADAAITSHQQRVQEGRDVVAERGNMTAERNRETTARKEVSTARRALQDAQQRLRAMEDSVKAIGAGRPPGPHDMVLLSNHIGMTFGGVRGARTGTDLIEAHRNARSLPENLEVMYQSLKRGDQLSPQQREEFIQAARDRVTEIQSEYDDVKHAWDYTPPGEVPTPKKGSGIQVVPGGAVDRLIQGQRGVR